MGCIPTSSKKNKIIDLLEAASEGNFLNPF